MQTLLFDRDMALSGEDRFTSLLAQDQYARELQWMEPLSEEQEADYSARLMDDKQAHQALIHAYLPLVSRIATSLWWQMNRRVDLMDLIQTGNMALLETLHLCMFEHGRRSFICYLVKHVRGEMLKSLYETHTIRIPPTALGTAKKQGREQDLLCLWNTVSVEQRSQREDGEFLLDIVEAPALILSPPADFSPEKVHLLALLLAELPIREREVLHCRYGLGSDGIAYSHQETADRLAMSETTAKIYETQALRRLQNLVAEYEQETGQTDTRWFDGDEGFSTYLEHRRQEKAEVPRATRTVNAQVYQAYTAMQEAGEKITGDTLARRAGTSQTAAITYLRTTKGHIPRSEQVQAIQTRLEQAYTAMQEAGEKITCGTLAHRAGVCQQTANKYIHSSRAAQEKGA